MRAERIVVPLLIILGLAFIIFQQPKELNSYVVNGRKYLFVHSLEEVKSIAVYPSAEAVRDFFISNGNFTISFDGSSPSDNGLFAKEGYNLANRIIRYFGDKGILKRVNATEGFPEGNGVIRFYGPNTGAEGDFVRLRDGVLEIHGKTKEGFEKSAEAVGYIILGLWESSQDSSGIPAGQQ